MDKLISLVSEKTGLSDEHSRQAVEVVIAYIKQRLPDSIAGQLDNLIDTDDDDDSAGGGVADLVKGFF